MPRQLASIRISNLRLRTFIGFNPEERVKKQDVVLNIEIRYAISSAALQDEVEHALNYKTITKRIIDHVENGQFLLLEKLVADVLALCSDQIMRRDLEFRVTEPLQRGLSAAHCCIVKHNQGWRCAIAAGSEIRRRRLQDLKIPHHQPRSFWKGVGSQPQA